VDDFRSKEQELLEKGKKEEEKEENDQLDSLLNNSTMSHKRSNTALPPQSFFEQAFDLEDSKYKLLEQQLREKDEDFEK